MKIVFSVYRRKRRYGQKLPRQHFRVDNQFSTKAKITKMTIAVSEAFGIGIDDERKFSVFSNFEMDLLPGQIILISGDSGSGKSTLLREICSQISARGKEEFPRGVVSNSSFEIDPEEVLIDGVGKDISDAISVLTMAGLSLA